MVVGRVIVDSPAAGAWNMSVDEALLRSVADGGRPVLRLYQWSPATLSLGYFQRLTDRERHGASSQCPVVRRSSGGGAIVHDREWTYSLAWPIGGGGVAGNRDLYRIVHQSLIDSFADWGVPLAWAGTAAESTAAGSSPFLCFQRRVAEDLVVGEDKVCGSAQRKRDRAILQHGSILMERSAHAPELPGIRDLVGTQLVDRDWIDAWTHRLGKQTSVRWQSDELGELEIQVAREVVDERFGNESWTGKR